MPGFRNIVEYNNLSEKQEAFERVIIITDHDEIGTESEISKKVENTGIYNLTTEHRPPYRKACFSLHFG